MLDTVLRRDRTIVIVALATLTGLAWAYTLWLARHMSMPAVAMSRVPDGSVVSMLAPGFKSWTAIDFLYVFVMWAVMMVGMMTPAVSPTVLLYARVGREARAQGTPFAATGAFGGGYLLAWTFFSLIATLSQLLLERAAILTPMMATASRELGSLVLIAAGLFQWTPLKQACLAYCQSPLIFIERHGGFQPSVSGSLVIGFRHGLYCVGCCWALMALLFVGGVMNVLWIALLTILVLFEKMIPGGRVLARVVGVGLILWGVSLALTSVAG